MHFQILQEPSDQTFSFQLVDDEDAVLLTSNPYPSRESCTDGIRSAIEALGSTDHFVTESDSRIVLNDGDGAPLARSEPLGTPEQAAATIEQIVEEALDTEQFDVAFTRAVTVSSTRPAVPHTLSTEEFAALYRFDRASRSETPGFELFQSEEDEEYYFHFNDEEGHALIYSRGFRTAGQRDRRIESVIRSASNRSRFDIIEDGSEYFFIVKARNGQEIARSRRFPSRDLAEAGVDLAAESVPPYAEQYVKKRTKRDMSGADDYVLAFPSPRNDPGFVTFRNPDTGEHYFHLNDEDGAPVLYSQGYSSAGSRDNGLKSVIRNSVAASSYVPREEDGAYYFAVIAGNRQEIARSRNFATAGERDAMITFLITWIQQFATAYGVTLPSERTETETLTLAGIQPGPDDATGSTVPAGDPDGRDEDEDRYAMAEEDRGGFRLWLPWIIPLVLLLLLLLFLLRGCFTGADLPPDGVAGDDTPSSGLVAGASEDDAEENNSGDENSGDENSGDENSGSQLAGESPDEEAPGGQAESNASAQPGAASSDQGAGEAAAPPLGPDAAALGFSEGSLEARIADMLSRPDRSLPQQFVMDAVQFPVHSAKLNKGAYTQVDNLIQLLKAYPGVVFEFQGHIDRTEDEDVARQFMNGEDITLSAVRARCLFKKFTEQDVDEAQLDFTGFGATQPIVNSDTEANRQRNRRLELVVKEK